MHPILAVADGWCALSYGAVIISASAVLTCLVGAETAARVSFGAGSNYYKLGLSSSKFLFFLSSAISLHVIMTGAVAIHALRRRLSFHVPFFLAFPGRRVASPQ